MSDEGAVEIKDLVKTYMDDRGRPTFTAVKNISLQAGVVMRRAQTATSITFADSVDFHGSYYCIGVAESASSRKDLAMRAVKSLSA